MVGFLPWQINFAMAKSIFAMKEELMVEIIVEKWQKTLDVVLHFIILVSYSCCIISCII